MEPYSVYNGRESKYGMYSREYDYPRLFRSHRDFDEQMSGSFDPKSKMTRSEGSDTSSAKQKRSLKTICSGFADMTSVQGINYIDAAEKKSHRNIWVLIFVACCGAMIFHLTYLSTVFFVWPKQSKIELGFDSLPFPAITLCNINPIRASMLSYSGEMMEILMESTSANTQIDHLMRPAENSTTTGAKRRRKRYLDDLSVNYTNIYSNYTDDWEDYDDKWAKQATRTTEAKVEEEFAALFSSLPRNRRVRIGHQLRDFMIRSSFAGRVVPNNNYYVMQSMTYGNCFTLSYNDFISRSGGPSDGLEAILFLENDEYIRGWTNGNGAHLVLHELGTVPLINRDGIALAGGAEIFIGIKRVNIERLGWPYGYCDDGTAFQEKFGLTYTRQSCQDYCMVQLLVDNCNCTDGRQDEFNRMFKFNDTHRECRSNAEIQCLVKWERAYQFGDYTSSCVCYSPCQETKFEKSVSSRQWPSMEYGRVLTEVICASSTEERCERLRNYDSYQLSQNFIKLNIYYEDLNYENITESEDYELAQYLSDIGGTLGLWIGLSVVSIFEIGQLIGQLFGVCCKCKKDKEKVEPHMRRDALPERVAYKAGYPATDLNSYRPHREY